MGLSAAEPGEVQGGDRWLPGRIVGSQQDAQPDHQQGGSTRKEPQLTAPPVCKTQ